MSCTVGKVRDQYGALIMYWDSLKSVIGIILLEGVLVRRGPAEARCIVVRSRICRLDTTAGGNSSTAWRTAVRYGGTRGDDECILPRAWLNGIGVVRGLALAHEKCVQSFGRQSSSKQDSFELVCLLSKTRLIVAIGKAFDVLRSRSALV